MCIDLEFDDPVVLKLFERLVCNQDVADRFKQFFARHRHKFQGARLDGEQKLQYTEVFQAYSELYDEILGDVVRETGCSMEEIAGRCREALKNSGSVDGFFLNAIVGASSYEKFVETMLIVDEPADAKGGDDAKDDAKQPDAYADSKDCAADAKDAK